jgi:hypothetical protein
MLVRLSQRIADCLERSRVCGEKAREACDSASQRDFSDLEDRWLALAQSYEFSERLASMINERAAQKRKVRAILGRAGADSRDSIAIACMTIAYVETMKAVSFTGAQRPESMTVARLVIDLTREGERDPDRLCNRVLRLLNAEEQVQRQISVP